MQLSKILRKSTHIGLRAIGNADRKRHKSGYCEPTERESFKGNKVKELPDGLKKLTASSCSLCGRNLMRYIY